MPSRRSCLERYHLDFVRAGAALDEAEQDRLRELNAELATLSAEFAVRLLAAAKGAAVHVSDVAELDGLSDDAIAAAAETATQRGLDGYLIELHPAHPPAGADLAPQPRPPPAGARRVRRARFRRRHRHQRPRPPDGDRPRPPGGAARLPDPQRLRARRPYGRFQRAARRDPAAADPGCRRERPSRSGPADRGAGRRHRRAATSVPTTGPTTPSGSTSMPEETVPGRR